MWVRGLKPRKEEDNIRFDQSHPMWVRGLKPRKEEDNIRFDQSHPMWVRGLKQTTERSRYLAAVVAPHVGAWIETRKYYRVRDKYYVAPHVGAWIETPKCIHNIINMMCRTPCGCVD